MAEFRGIKTCLFLIVMLQFAEAATRQRLTVRDGDEVTLPCGIVTEDQNKCDSTQWFYYLRSGSHAVVLVGNGQIVEAKAESHRLSVSQKCSLVVKNVTQEDVGLYICRPGGQYEDAEVVLSVVSMTEETIGDEVTLRCSVGTYHHCLHTVKWTNGGQDVDKDNKELKTSQSSCSVSLSFKTSHFFHTSGFTSLKCEVTDGDKVMKFPLRNSPSNDETGKDTTTTKTEEDTKAGDTTTSNREDSPEPQQIWVYVLLAVVLVALLIFVVFVVKWKINKGNTTRANNNHGSTPQRAAEAPLAVGPEEGVSYASVSYTQKPDSKAQRRGNHDDDSVTYSTVKASPADSKNLYASIA